MGKGDFLIPYSLTTGEISITCPVCGLQSPENKSREELEATPYVCGCGTKYQTRMESDHWHLSIEIPESVLKNKNKWLLTISQ